MLAAGWWWGWWKAGSASSWLVVEGVAGSASSWLVGGEGWLAVLELAGGGVGGAAAPSATHTCTNVTLFSPT